ncbi:MAG: hypothetical protein JRF33_15390 [Deltaproteobacteria bacterium]|nr:hypothetical protein [Deltaproteobacteria bacterium]
MNQRKVYNRRKRSQRGSAMVEFSVLMLAFVPMILLPLYFVDAMRYKLEAQEAVYMSVWDFAFGDYSNSSAGDLAGGIDSTNQKLYANFLAGDETPRTDGTPLGPWADAQWSTDLDCKTVDGDFASDAYSPGGMSLISLPANFHEKFKNGGLVTCKGGIDVANFYVPTGFLDGGGNDLASKPMFNQAPGGSDWLTYNTIEMGLMVDPWCIHETEDIDGVCEDGKYCERVNFVWSEASSVFIQYMAWAWVAWILFAAEMIMDINLTTIAMSPDDPHKLKMSVKHPPTGKRLDHFLTPMTDGKEDEYQKTYEERDEYYLGCKNFNEGVGNCD